MMPRDLYYDLVKNALRKDGWRLTYTLLPLKKGAGPATGESWTTQLLGAEKDERRIAVAVNSFIGHSEPDDIMQALQQLALSLPRMHTAAPGHVLYLAVRQATYRACFTGHEGARLLASQPLSLLVFDPRAGTIVQWCSGEVLVHG
jgi:hypothetical protein